MNLINKIYNSYERKKYAFIIFLYKYNNFLRKSQKTKCSSWKKIISSCESHF